MWCCESCTAAHASDSMNRVSAEASWPSLASAVVSARLTRRCAAKQEGARGGVGWKQGRQPCKQQAMAGGAACKQGAGRRCAHQQHGSRLPAQHGCHCIFRRFQPSRYRRLQLWLAIRGALSQGSFAVRAGPRRGGARRRGWRHRWAGRGRQGVGRQQLWCQLQGGVRARKRDEMAVPV